MPSDPFPPPPAPLPTTDRVELKLPPLEDRPYRYVALPNGVEAIVISDEDAHKGAACLLVEAGTMNDPPDLPGCAHLCERVIIHGSKNFPDPDSFKKYIDKHGGSHSAGPQRAYTEHRFDVASDALYGALARAADFVINPLFSEDRVEREVAAIESEFKQSLNNDDVRTSILLGSLARSGHPFNHFNRGNRDTLWTTPKAAGRNPRDELASWWKANSCARRIKLVVAGREDVDTLQAWVEELFGPAQVVTEGMPPTGPNGVYRTYGSPFGANEVGKVAFMQTLQDTRRLQIHIPVPDDRHMHLTRPFDFAILALSYMGKGSITSKLRRKGWITELWCYELNNIPGSGLVEIDIRLTSEGLENWAEVVRSIFTAINVLKANTNDLGTLFDEQRRLLDLAWTVTPKLPSHYAVWTTAVRLRYPVPRDLVISSESLYGHFDPDLVEAALGHLKLEDSVVLISSQHLPTNVSGSYDKTEPIYGTLYTTRPLDELVSTADLDDPDLHLPSPNPYIPKRWDVPTADAHDGPPRLLSDTPVSRLWYKQDLKDRPIANVKLKLASPSAFGTPRAAVLSELFAHLFANATAEEEDDAGLAGLRIDTGPQHGQGYYELDAHGPSDTIGVLVVRFVGHLRDFALDDSAAFAGATEELKARYTNFAISTQHAVACVRADYAVQKGAWTEQDKLRALEGLTLADVEAFRRTLLDRLHIEALVCGSIEAKDAQKLLADVEQILHPEPLDAAEVQGPPASLLIPEGYDGIWERPSALPADDQTNVVVYTLYAEHGADDVKSRTLVALLHEITKAPFTDTFADEQLGHLVKVRVSAVQGSLVRFLVAIQSERDPSLLESRVTQFLDDTLGKLLRDLSAEDLATHVESVVSGLQESTASLYSEAREHWARITDGYYDFDRRATEIAQLRGTTKDELLAFYNSAIHSSSKTRRKLSVRIRSQGLEPDPQGEATYITDIAAWKDNLVAAERAVPVRPLVVETGRVSRVL
ncbi:Putative zinc protease [Vanrija pseudolonga]|uniref:Zinc protease n=1 Tax=Vanrija pseudolonga TaxID=143232 RepID=A0AAF0Y848_9TREE|nr:Putative zinc protease [Vanrija pseudolonga]